MVDKQKINKRVSEMGHSLLDEGYRIRINTKLPTCYFIKLKHKKNSNEITIVGNYEKSLIKLFRSGKLKHEEYIE